MPPSASQPDYKQSYVASPHDLHRWRSKALGPTMLLSWQNTINRDFVVPEAGLEPATDKVRDKVFAAQYPRRSVRNRGCEYDLRVTG